MVATNPDDDDRIRRPRPFRASYPLVSLRQHSQNIRNAVEAIRLAEEHRLAEQRRLATEEFRRSKEPEKERRERTKKERRERAKEERRKEEEFCRRVQELDNKVHSQKVVRQGAPAPPRETHWSKGTLKVSKPNRPESPSASKMVAILEILAEFEKLPNGLGASQASGGYDPKAQLPEDVQNTLSMKQNLLYIFGGARGIKYTGVQPQQDPNRDVAQIFGKMAEPNLTCLQGKYRTPLIGREFRQVYRYRMGEGHRVAMFAGECFLLNVNTPEYFRTNIKLTLDSDRKHTEYDKNDYEVVEFIVDDALPQVCNGVVAFNKASRVIFPTKDHRTGIWKGKKRDISAWAGPPPEMDTTKSKQDFVLDFCLPTVKEACRQLVQNPLWRETVNRRGIDLSEADLVDCGTEFLALNKKDGKWDWRYALPPHYTFVKEIPIDMSEDPDVLFEKYFPRLQEFYRTNKHCIVPSGSSLYYFCHRIRRLFANEELEDNMIKQLNAIDFSWEGNKHARWEQNFSKLRIFKAVYGHCQVPFHYQPDLSLGAWVLRQVHQQSTPQYVAKLKEIGFRFAPKRKGLPLQISEAKKPKQSPPKKHMQHSKKSPASHGQSLQGKSSHASQHYPPSQHYPQMQYYPAHASSYYAYPPLHQYRPPHHYHAETAEV